ncbi:unnamed protein product [Toxocara canis]|uniref:CPSF_A domain-containing protein n=1 Tax=Toxocara canis TaxID=6265 RepID=A0A183V7V7_TOXCA|nr:unnamed protein product [Toxocara canis]
MREQLVEFSEIAVMSDKYVYLGEGIVGLLLIADVTRCDIFDELDLRPQSELHPLMNELTTPLRTLSGVSLGYGLSCLISTFSRLEEHENCEIRKLWAKKSLRARNIRPNVVNLANFVSKNDSYKKVIS